MNSFEGAKALLREKDGKRLIAFSAIIFLLITAIVFFSVFRHCENIQLKLMDEYLWEIPKVIESRDKEWRMHTSIYEDDILTRAEVGLMLYAEDDAPADAERLA